MTHSHLNVSEFNDSVAELFVIGGKYDMNIVPLIYKSGQIEFSKYLYKIL